MKRYLSVLLALMLLFTMASPAFADGIIGEMETEVEIRGLTEFNVRMIVSRYFAQRKAYLQGTADTITSVVPAMVTDEAAHKEAMVDAGAVLVDSTVVVNSVEFWDDRVPVTATETVTYQIAGENIQETVVHDIVVLFDAEGCLYVTSDGYASSLFASAAYVPPEIQAAAETNAGGSSLCILTVAVSQIGITENSDGSSKYGIWYAEQINDPWPRKVAWCAMFVTWCADHANVATSVIPFEATVPYAKDWFANRGIFYTPSNSSYSPRAGDLFFHRTSYIDEDGNTVVSEYGHVGFIRSVSGGYIYVVDGNTGDPDRVRYYAISLSDTILTGFARPNYASTTHTYGSAWYFDDSYHWRTCSNCNYGQVDRAAHVLVEDPVTGGVSCRTCLYGSATVKPLSEEISECTKE